MSFFWHSGVGRIRWHFQSEQCGVLVLDINWQPQNEMARSVMKTHVSDLLSPPLVCDYIIICTQHAWLVSASSAACGALSDCDDYVSEGICYRQIRLLIRSGLSFDTRLLTPQLPSHLHGRSLNAQATRQHEQLWPP